MQVPDTTFNMSVDNSNNNNYQTGNITAVSSDSNTDSTYSPQNTEMYQVNNSGNTYNVEEYDLSLIPNYSGKNLSETSNYVSQRAVDVENITNINNDNVQLDNSETAIDYSKLTEEDFAQLVGQMTEEEYDQFVNGIEDYYNDQLSYLDPIFNGEKGLVALRDRLSIFNAEVSSSGIYLEQKKALDAELENRYQMYVNGMANIETLGITYEEFQQLEYEERIELISQKDPQAIQCIQNFEDTIRDFYDERVSEEFSDLGITTYEEFLQLCDETNAQISIIEEAITNIKHLQDSAKYDYLYYLEDYKNFNAQDIDLDSYLNTLEDGVTVTNSTTYDKYYSYEKYHMQHPEVSPSQFIKLLEAAYPSSSYNVIDLNAEEIRTLNEVAELFPDFAKTYEYLYSQDPEKAAEYLEDCKYEINNVKGQMLANDFLSTLGVADGDNDAIEMLANELGVSVQGLRDGIDSFGQGVYYSIEALMVGLGLMDENRTMSPEEYKKMYILQGLLSDETKEAMGLIYRDENGEYQNTNPNSVIDYTQRYAGPVLSCNYEISQGIGNMLPSMLASTLCPMAGSIALGVSSGGNAYHSAMVDGQSYLSAVTYGLFTGSSEALTEWLLGGIPGLSDVEVTSLQTYLQAIGGEGLQEGFQGVIDSIYQAAFMGQPLPNTPEGWEAYFKDIMKQSLYGAITAGILQSPSLITRINTNTTDGTSPSNETNISGELENAPSTQQSTEHVTTISDISSIQDIAQDIAQIFGSGDQTSEIIENAQSSVDKPDITETNYDLSRGETNVETAFELSEEASSFYDRFDGYSELSDAEKIIEFFKADYARYEEFTDAFVEMAKNGDPTILLFMDALNRNIIKLDIRYDPNSESGYNPYTHTITIGEDFKYDRMAFFHEFAHALFDQFIGDSSYENSHITSDEALNGLYERIMEELSKTNFLENEEAIRKYYNELSKEILSEIKGEDSDALLRERIESYENLPREELEEIARTLGLKVDEDLKVEEVAIRSLVAEELDIMRYLYQNSDYMVYSAITGLCDSLTKGEFSQENHLPGHSSDYYATDENPGTIVINEAFAYYMSLRLSNNEGALELVRTLIGDEYYDLLESIYNEVVEGINSGGSSSNATSIADMLDFMSNY